MNSPEVFVTSILPLLLLIIASLVIALSEQLILVNIFYKLFSRTLFNKFISIIMSSLLYSFLLLNFDPGRILINFLAASISLFIYSKTESILTSSFFIASYYSIYIIYIFGWNYIGF
ncbi:CPBP family glutamic-type intramembrane protease [Halocella sp. SP3-1]|uniref:CPBP family glutamic-type intramembrane protease n=1 Tax=Halocella sp. SP3-1 TaxID=2382161 RepID=UPI00336AC757